MMLALFDGCFVVLCTFGFRYTNLILHGMLHAFLLLIFCQFYRFFIRSCKYIFSQDLICYRIFRINSF